MHYNSPRPLTAFLLLFLLSLFATADAAPQEPGATAEWKTSPEKVRANTDTGLDAPPGAEENLQQHTQIKRTADYGATSELLSERYPYALMSFFSEVDTILTSEDLEKQIFTMFRLSYLHSRHYHLVAEPEAIPEKWQPHFIATRMQTHKSGKNTRQIIAQITIPNSNIRARVFEMAEDADPLSDIPTKGKIVLALSGEKSNKALQCLVTQAKSSYSASSACSLAIKTLQDITDLADSLKEQYPNHSLEITGYSFSGAIAQIAMTTTRSIDQAYIFNSYGIHPSWLEDTSENRLSRIHHSYVEGSFLHGQDYNPVSRYSRWKLPQNKVAVAGMKIASSGLEPHIRQIYKLNHRDSWLDTFYNYVTSIWVLHSKESVLRAFEVHLKFNFPW